MNFWLNNWRLHNWRSRKPQLKTQYLLSAICHLIIFWQNFGILLTVTTQLTIYMGTHANYGQHTKRDLGEGSMTLGNFFELILPFNLSKHNCFLSPSFNTSFTLYLKMFKLTQIVFVLLTIDWKDFNDFHKLLLTFQSLQTQLLICPIPYSSFYLVYLWD